MSELRPSLAVLLSEESVEPDPRKFFVTPLSGGESWLATLGLTRRLHMLNTEITRASINGQVPENVSLPLFSKLDEYRQRAVNFSDVLSPFAAEYPGSRPYQAMHIAMLARGQQLHKEGNWSTKPFDGQPTLRIFERLQEVDEPRFTEAKQWGYRRARENRIAWEKELMSNRGHRVVAVLRQSVALAEPLAAEV